MIKSFAEIIEQAKGARKRNLAVADALCLLSLIHI